MLREDFQMRCVSVFVAFSILLLVAFPKHADAQIGEEERDDVVGLFGALLVPSIFTAASSERIGAASLYGRTLTGEGDVPDFDGDFRDNVDQLQIFASGRIGGLGVTIGFGQGSDFEFSQPFILSADYKLGLMKETPIVDAAADVQYSMIVLPDEKDIEVSALGFGVFSISGMVSANLLFLAEPYGILTFNYIYLNPEEEDFIGVLKVVPKIGLKFKVLPMVSVGAEIGIITSEHLDTSWMWNIGVTAGL
jgi:hypothetical protein